MRDPETQATIQREKKNYVNGQRKICLKKKF